MSLLMRRQSKFFLEADDDNNDGDAATGEDTGGTENSDTSSSDGDTSNDDSDNTDDTSDQNDDDDNYDIDSEPDDDQNDDDENQDNEDNDDDDNSEEGDDNDESDGDSTDSDDSGDSDFGDSEDTDSDEKEMDRQLFDSLTPAEKQQKIKTQKRLFLDLYNQCTAIIDKYDAAINTHEEISEIGRSVITTLYDLKSNITDYVTGLFNSNSYIQNDVQFQVFLSVFNGIKMITKDVVKIVEENEK